VLDLRVTDEPDEGASAELRDRVIASNVSRTGYNDGRSLSCFVRDDAGGLVAGLDGFTWGGYLMIEWLWVADELRGQGLGQRLVEAAEQAAVARGCRVARANTHSFQAPGFYAKLGYQQCGFAADTPAGFGESFLIKRLVSDDANA
jgi:GNAT superfamily N-acetyltransferase